MNAPQQEWNRGKVYNGRHPIPKTGGSAMTTKPRAKLTVADYLDTPEGVRCQLLDGELILAAAPNNQHQTILLNLAASLRSFVRSNELGKVWIAPFDVVFSDHDVVQPDILYVSRRRAAVITAANIQGAPDLAVEVLSPSTEGYDRGYKRELYARHGVMEYWLVDPDLETIEVLTPGDGGFIRYALYNRRETLTSPLLPGLAVDLAAIFGE